MIRDTYSLTRFLRPLSFYPHIRCKRLIKQNRELSTDYKPDVYLSSLLLLGAEWEQEQVQQGIRYTSGEKTFAARLQPSAILCFMCDSCHYGPCTGGPGSNTNALLRIMGTLCVAARAALHLYPQQCSCLLVRRQRPLSEQLPQLLSTTASCTQWVYLLVTRAQLIPLPHLNSPPFRLREAQPFAEQSQQGPSLTAQLTATQTGLQGLSNSQGRTYRAAVTTMVAATGSQWWLWQWVQGREA